MSFDALPSETTNPRADQIGRDLDVMRRARAAVAMPGAWCQWSFGNDAGPRCAVEHLHSARADDKSTLSVGLWLRQLFADEDRQVEILAAGLPRVGRYPANAIITWNDRQGRTQAEVVALFDRAIARLESAVRIADGNTAYTASRHSK